MILVPTERRSFQRGVWWDIVGMPYSDILSRNRSIAPTTDIKMKKGKHSSVLQQGNGLLHYGHGSPAHFSKGTIVPLSPANIHDIPLSSIIHLPSYRKHMENIGKSWKHMGYRFIPDVSANMAACGCLLLDITPRFLSHKVAFGARGRHGSRSGAARVGDDTTWRSVPMGVPNSDAGRSVRTIPLYTMTELLILARNSNSLHMQKLKPTQFPRYCMKKRRPEDIGFCWPPHACHCGNVTCFFSSFFSMFHPLPPFQKVPRIHVKKSL